MCECFVNHILYICFILSACYQPNTITTAAVFFVVYYLFSNDNIVLCRRHHDCSHLTSHLWRNHLLIYDICMCVYMYIYIYIYIFLFGNTWLIAWHVSYLDYMGGPYESGSHCNQCKDLPTFSTVLFCCLHYCINVIYYVLFCLINYFQVQVQVQANALELRLSCSNRSIWCHMYMCNILFSKYYHQRNTLMIQWKKKD